MSINVISVDNLTFCYNGLEVISDISFAVKKGDYLGIAGPNGSGKSTLIKNILGILAAAKGMRQYFRPAADFFSAMEKNRLSAPADNRLESSLPQHGRRDRSTGNKAKKYLRLKTRS